MADDPYPTGRTLDIVVPVELAKTFFADQLAKDLKLRPVYPLTLGEGAFFHDLGKWQIVGVSTVRHEAGYFQAVATMREVY